MAFDFAAARSALAAADRDQLAESLRTLPGSVDRPSAELAGALVDWPAAHILQPFRHDCFQVCVATSAARRQGLPHTTTPDSVPTSLDFIADIGGLPDWTAEQCLARLLLDTLNPSRQTAVVGTMRDDGIYILEWIAHYRALGFEHLFVYTNDNADGSDALLAALAHGGVVTVFRNDISGEVPPEAKAFGHALNLLPELRDFEWALFVDSDEFLVPAPRYGLSIAAVLDALQAAHPDGTVAGICYDWMWFVSDAMLERHPGPLCERFQHARPHWLAKCLVRPRDVLSMRRQHYPEMMPGFRFVDSAFNFLEEAEMATRHVAQYAGGRINHYWPKSFQEFAVKKARGASLGGEQNIYDRPYRTFFQWNGPFSPDNHQPTDPEMLRRIHAGIAELRRLPGVADCADRIEREFPQLVERAAPAAQLRQHYLRNKVPPGPL